MKTDWRDQRELRQGVSVSAVCWSTVVTLFKLMGPTLATHTLLLGLDLLHNTSAYICYDVTSTQRSTNLLQNSLLSFYFIFHTQLNVCLFIVTKPINQNDIFHISSLFTLSGLRCSVLRHKVCDSIFMTTTTKVGMITFDVVWLGDASLGPCDLCIIHQSQLLQQSQDCKLFTFIVGANGVWS